MVWRKLPAIRPKCERHPRTRQHTRTRRYLSGSTNGVHATNETAAADLLLSRFTFQHGIANPRPSAGAKAWRDFGNPDSARTKNGRNRPAHNTGAEPCPKAARNRCRQTSRARQHRRYYTLHPRAAFVINQAGHHMNRGFTSTRPASSQRAAPIDLSPSFSDLPMAGDINGSIPIDPATSDKLPKTRQALHLARRLVRQ